MHDVLGAVAVHVKVFAAETLALLAPVGTAVAVYVFGAIPVVGAFHDTRAFVPLIFTRMSVGFPGATPLAVEVLVFGADE